MDKRALLTVNFYFFACYSIVNAGAQSAFDIAHPEMDIFANTDKCPTQLKAKATGPPLSAFKEKRGAVGI